MDFKTKTPLILFLFLLTFFAGIGQKKISFGTLTQAEKNFTIYEKDTTATAIYLFEKGDNYFEVRNNFVRLITQYHVKIKILKKDGISKSEISIPYYHTKSRSEKVQKIKAFSHNEGIKTAVLNSTIYTVDVDENWSEKKFAIPNAKIGSVIEYTYEIESPFFFNLNGWDFQSDIPKVYTEYNAKIPANWTYNRTLSGKIELDVNEADILKECFWVEGYSKSADCEVVKYVMKNVPAFAENESFMLSSSNYRSKLEFELREYVNFKGEKRRYTKRWKDVDKEYRTDKDFGSQLRKKNFFEKNVPADLFVGSDELEKAKNIYNFVQAHYTWNGKYGLWKDNRVKNAFDAQKGNIAEINITLINLLNAAGIKTEMMLTATRNRGLPKKAHPVMSDFNYIIAKTNIGGKDYLLDASVKHVPFGMLPYKSLNYYGRVMDFDEESYWFDISPEKNNKNHIQGIMDLEIQSTSIKGKLRRNRTGYEAINGWQEIKSQTKEEYFSSLEEDFKDNFYITNHKVIESKSNEKLLVEELEFEREFKGDIVYLDPFIIKFFEKNPFQASKRNYPIDFGYLRTNKYIVTINLPDGYKVKSLPESKAIVLPGNAGVLKFQCEAKQNNSLNLFFNFKLNATQYKSEYYQIIKDFFQEVANVQTKSIIVLEKT